jgi:hypothetical protein
MSAVGPTTAPQGALDLETSWTSPLQTVGSSDVLMTSLFNCGLFRRVVPQSAGALAIKRLNDAAFTVYQALQGNPIDGQIIAVGGTGSGSGSGVTYVCEL